MKDKVVFKKTVEKFNRIFCNIPWRIEGREQVLEK